MPPSSFKAKSPSTIGIFPFTFAIFPLQLIPKHTTFAASKTKNNKL